MKVCFKPKTMKIDSIYFYDFSLYKSIDFSYVLPENKNVTW